MSTLPLAANAADTPAPAPSVAAGHAQPCDCHDATSATPELDARLIPHAVRHGAVFGALDSVAPGAGLVVVAPHDPRRLLDQIEQRWPSTFAVDYLEQGPDAWRVQLTRTATASVT